MGWELKRYYTRSRKIAGKVVREYFGNGPEGRLAAGLDQQRPERKRQEREAIQADREQWSKACGPLDELIAVTDLLAAAILLAGGYYRHDRGAWRRRREYRYRLCSKSR